MNQLRMFMGKGADGFTRLISPAMLAAILVAIITCIALFTKPYIGMADNGDYFRIIYGNGLYFNDPDYYNQYFGYFVKQYGLFQYFNENAAPLASSQSLFIKLAIAINKLVYDHGIFDIRIQGVIYTVLLIGAVFLLVEGVTWKVSRKRGYLIAILAVFMFGDTGYTAYFNSFYGESVVYIMAILLAASGVLLYRKRYNDYVMLFLFTLSAVLLTTSKQQNVTVGIIVGLIGGILIYLHKNKTYRFVAAMSMIILFMSGIATYALIPKEFVEINQYHAMTRGPLLHTDNPEETLNRFGINEQYSILSKSIYYELYTTIDVESPMLRDDFYSRYGFGSILGYYISNPGKTIEMLDLAAQHAFTIRPTAMGNYEKSEARPFGEKASFFSTYSTFKKQLSPKTFGFILLWVVIVCGLYLASFIGALKRKNIRDAIKLPLMVMMILVGLSGIAVSIIGAGDADLAKHLFLFTVMFDLVTFITIADALGVGFWRYNRLQRGEK
ncbi:hypothetical protein I6N90_06835 [Paenibacillus sp. GSMTC-2017]|uniref:glycan biosynthesis hexose transferase WsfD n=1 Tax=Paenibacillus sp. GSMTC-2017 TaxID=2794350 RepID=UPI0018D9B4FA|nr:hypothetical protein [Paenibacillus sp. GSMTC-2017]MBH5317531.1 hypothetical protein [Paenibacillus sp. GSMTC-2017]